MIGRKRMQIFQRVSGRRTSYHVMITKARAAPYMLFRLCRLLKKFVTEEAWW